MKELSDYNISKRTGCVLEHPLTRLPPLYEPWQKIMDSMWTLLAEKRLRDEVHKLPVLDTSELQSYEQLCLAHVQLAMIGASFVWQEGRDGATKSIPRGVAVPLWAVSERLGLPPLMTYSDVLLMNIIINHDAPEDGPETDRVKTIHSFSGLKEWSIFNAVTGVIEMHFAKAVPSIVEAAKLSRESNSSSEQLAKLLNEVAALTESMKTTMKSYRGNLDADIFFTKMLPFFEGWDKDSKTHPEGLVYEGVTDQPQHFTSASAGQALIMQACDFLLGNKHPEGLSQRQEIMRKHMLKGHREFLTDLREFSKVSECTMSRRDPVLTEAFNRLQRAVQDFRSSHVGMFISYAAVPSRKVLPPEEADEENKKILTYLKALRESTTDQIIQDTNSPKKE